MVERATHSLGEYREHRPPPDLGEVLEVAWVYARSGEPGSGIPAPGHRMLPESGVSLPLGPGENEVWLAVSENFGGWGVEVVSPSPAGR